MKAKTEILTAERIVKVVGEGAGQVLALKGVNVALRTGELTLLMGPSGSGKTTLLSILGCILSTTEGEVTIAGQKTSGLGPEGLARVRREHVGLIFQSYNLFPTLNSEENVMIGLDVRGIRGREAQKLARTTLERVGLGHRLTAYSKTMSGGEKQRVAVARAVAASPSVVLADEPTAALDSENGRAVMALLADIARDPSRAVLAVTHDPRTLPYAGRIIRIEDGRIVGDERSRLAPAAASRSKYRGRSRVVHA